MTTRPVGADPWWLTAVRWPLWSWPRLVGTVAAFVALTSLANVAQDRILGTADGSATSPALGAAAAAASTTPSPATGSADAAAGTGAFPASGPPGTAVAGTSPTGVPATLGSLLSPEPVPTPTGPVTVPQSRAAWVFVSAWARPDAPAAAWFASLEPLSTTRLATLLRDTDPGRVPASRVLDPSPAATAATAEPSAKATSAKTTSAKATSAKTTSAKTPDAKVSASPSPTPILAFGSTQAVTVRTDAGAVVVGLFWDGTHWLVDSIAPTGQPG